MRLCVDVCCGGGLFLNHLCVALCSEFTRVVSTVTTSLFALIPQLEVLAQVTANASFDPFSLRPSSSFVLNFPFPHLVSPNIPLQLPVSSTFSDHNPAAASELWCWSLLFSGSLRVSARWTAGVQQVLVRVCGYLLFVCDAMRCDVMCGVVCGVRVCCVISIGIRCRSLLWLRCSPPYPGNTSPLALCISAVLSISLCHPHGSERLVPTDPLFTDIQNALCTKNAFDSSSTPLNHKQNH